MWDWCGLDLGAGRRSCSDQFESGLCMGSDKVMVCFVLDAILVSTVVLFLVVKLCLITT